MKKTISTFLIGIIFVRMRKEKTTASEKWRVICVRQLLRKR